jgi:hypothetical protein
VDEFGLDDSVLPGDSGTNIWELDEDLKLANRLRDRTMPEGKEESDS